MCGKGSVMLNVGYELVMWREHGVRWELRHDWQEDEVIGLSVAL